MLGRVIVNESGAARGGRVVRPPEEGDIEVHGGYVQRTAEVTDSRPHSWALRALSAEMSAVDRVVPPPAIPLAALGRESSDETGRCPVSG